MTEASTPPSERAGPHQRRLSPVLMDCKAAGEYTGFGERYMRRLVFEKRIAYVKVGHMVRFERATLDKFIEDHRVDPTT
ncbi:helix-turn-helix domain-containing protein [Blastococcus saxobsidens]|uniref:Excisionase family DNA binding protein n=1 Tax=Blastococcus saxobsidens TaxID=138336 RepID=A0A4Q7YBB4_9ACTN|nr:helix-turn-helix domain-containing protein [Blastococcus saxobsidens]RZU33415.1 excisionase family DNA binding protein [Blastococcus saxobsidens]